MFGRRFFGGRFFGGRFFGDGGDVVEPLVPIADRTITIAARLHSLVVPARNYTRTLRARVRYFIARQNMIHQMDSKRSDESPVFTLDIRKELALAGDTIISSVTASIELHSGQTDPDVADMLIGSATATGTKISARVGAGLSGNSYNVKFAVVTPQQELSFVANIPVDDDGAFDD